MTDKIRPNFRLDGSKKIYCSNCKHFLCEVSWKDKNYKPVKCGDCKTKYIIYPPTKGQINGERVIKYGPGQETMTADLTDDDFLVS